MLNSTMQSVGGRNHPRLEASRLKNGTLLVCYIQDSRHPVSLSIIHLKISVFQNSKKKKTKELIYHQTLKSCADDQPSKNNNMTFGVQPEDQSSRTIRILESCQRFYSSKLKRDRKRAFRFFLYSPLKRLQLSKGKGQRNYNINNS